MSEAIKKLAESLENTKVEQDGAIVVITMNRPKALNALNDQTLGELDRIFSCIETEAEVLGAAGEPIPGLYAAGEVTGGVHGAAALPGNELTGLLVFGRRAGQNAAGWLSAQEERQENSDV